TIKTTEENNNDSPKNFTFAFIQSMKAKVFSGQSVLLFFLFAVIFFSCKPVYDLRHINFSDSYKPLQSFLFTHASVIHKANDTSLLVLEIPVTENGFQKDSAHFFVRFRLYDNLNGLVINDSVKVLVNSFPSGDYYHLEIPFHLQMNAHAWLYLHLTENASLKHFEQLIPLDKSNTSNGFIYAEREELHEKYILPYTQANCTYSVCNSFGSDTFRVWFYNYPFQLATPTFFEPAPYKFPDRVDTVFVFTTADTFRLTKQGLYVFHSTTHPDLQFSLLCAANSFPLIDEPIQMAKPLRYISKNEEYDYLTQKNIKARVDSFWLDKSGSMEHAKVQIKRYYNRVQFANEFFTSYQEGWQTDKGLVYIIFGAPDEVYYDADAEWWYFRSRGNRSAIHYKFVAIENPFGAVAQQLIRSSNYFDSWNRQGYAWRHGLAD
ncbi:MAG: GWxTD domain-containing protein, partial [Bacteroidota bacterium]